MPTAGGLESKPRSGCHRDHERFRAATSSRAQASGSRASVCLSRRPGACDSQRTCRFVAVASSSGRRVRALVARCRPLKDGSVSYRRATQGHMCRTSRLSTALTKNGGETKVLWVWPCWALPQWPCRMGWPRTRTSVCAEGNAVPRGPEFAQ